MKEGDMTTDLQWIGFSGTKRPINFKIVDSGSSPETLFELITSDVFAVF